MTSRMVTGTRTGRCLALVVVARESNFRTLLSADGPHSSVLEEQRDRYACEEAANDGDGLGLSRLRDEPTVRSRRE